MIGLGIMAALSIHGTAEAATLVITSATMYVRKRNVLIASYITSSFSTTIFLFCFIICCSVINQISSEMTLEKGLGNLSRCVLYGFPSYFAGRAMGKICKASFPILAIEKRFFLVFFMMATIVEVMLVFSFVMSLISA